MHEKPQVNLRVHNARALREMRSPLNRLGTGQIIHRSPDVLSHEDRNALALNHIATGGIARLSESHEIAA